MPGILLCAFFGSKWLLLYSLPSHTIVQRRKVLRMAFSVWVQSTLGNWILKSQHKFPGVSRRSEEVRMREAAGRDQCCLWKRMAKVLPVSWFKVSILIWYLHGSRLLRLWDLGTVLSLGKWLFSHAPCGTKHRSLWLWIAPLGETQWSHPKLLKAKPHWWVKDALRLKTAAFPGAVLRKKEPGSVGETLMIYSKIKKNEDQVKQHKDLCKFKQAVFRRNN